MYPTRPSARLRQEPITGRKSLRDEPAMRKERETKDDGRYIIFYAFEEDERAPDEDDEG